MGRDLLLPEGMEPQPERIEFRPVEAVIPGYVMRRGDYERVSPALVILAAAHRDDADELDEVVLGDLTFWAEVIDPEGDLLPPPAGELGEEAEEEEFDPAQFVAEQIEDCDMRHFAIQIAAAEESDRGYIWLIDKAISARTVHWYVGGDEVSVSTNNNTSVRFRRTGYNGLDVPKAREKKPAPKGCSIKAVNAANYNIAGAGRFYNTTKF